jgi:ABC-type Fe3+ transport system substrate-binding protein
MEAAEKFTRFLLDEEGQTMLASFGFVPIETGERN